MGFSDNQGLQGGIQSISEYVLSLCRVGVRAARSVLRAGVEFARHVVGPYVEEVRRQREMRRLRESPEMEVVLADQSGRSDGSRPVPKWFVVVVWIVLAAFSAFAKDCNVVVNFGGTHVAVERLHINNDFDTWDRNAIVP